MQGRTPGGRPTANMAGAPGGARVRFGGGLRKRRVAVNVANAANTPDKAAVDRPLTSCGPSRDPTRIPGLSRQQIAQMTASCAWFVRTLEI